MIIAFVFISHLLLPHSSPISYNGNAKVGQFEIENLSTKTTSTDTACRFIGIIQMKRIYNCQMTALLRRPFYYGY